MAKISLDEILKDRVIAIIRGVREEQIIDVVEALVQGGITALEVTVESPGAFRSLEKVALHLQGRAIVGAGTVLDSESARLAIAAGAEFLISPNLNTKMIEITKRHGKIAIPGVLTPTEIVSAIQAGADAVKIFPAGTMGPKYIKELKGPLPHIKMLATGGVTLQNAKDFLDYGADGLGVGGSLINKDYVKQGSFEGIAKLTKQFIELLN